ncbi:hypothetical protein NC652_024596 [Populus alba x Populus x berolinensis]|nr:hypothetical protein NC652_024596 [Populus alba x Populus x berolinensis]
MSLLEVYLEAHGCTTEEEWLKRWSCHWRRKNLTIPRFLDFRCC